MEFLKPGEMCEKVSVT